MSRLAFALLLFLAALVLFLEGRGLLRVPLAGTRLDLLPALLVYAAWRGELRHALAFAAAAGLLLDSISAVPLGAGPAALAAAAIPLEALRSRVRREEIRAQALAGLGAGLLVSLAGLILARASGGGPVAYASAGGHLLLIALANAAFAPLLFRAMDWLADQLDYKEVPAPAERQEVETQRGI